jgi:hypothetical protein
LLSQWGSSLLGFEDIFHDSQITRLKKTSPLGFGNPTFEAKPLLPSGQFMLNIAKSCMARVPGFSPDFSNPY